jgi:L-asparaginase
VVSSLYGGILARRRVSASLLAVLVLTATFFVAYLPGGSAGGAPAPGVAASDVVAVSPGPAAQRGPKASRGLPKVTVVATGGTIAGQSSTPTSFQNYRAGTLLIADMLAEIPNLDQVAEVDSIQFGNKGSGGYTINELFDLSLAVEEALKKSDGVVVTTGTDTMEEIGYFLDLTVQSPKPVVMTGAMRPWTVIGSDAQANLFNAIVTAASGKTGWFGTVLMLNDEIHTVRDVTKSSSLRMDTFQTPEFGVLGYVDDLKVRIMRTPARAMRVFESRGNVVTAKDALKAWRTPFDLSKITKGDLPRVEIFYNYQEAGGEPIDAWTAAGVEGIVTAGTGAGGISSAAGQARNRAIAEGVVFASTTRTGSGSVYGGNASVFAADSLNAQHARLLLMMALAFNDSTADVRADFLEWAGLQGDLTESLPSLSLR